MIALRWLRRLASVLLVGGASDAAAETQAILRDGIVTLRAGDPAMAAAIRKARAGLTNFLRLAHDPPQGTRNFSLKVGIPVGNDIEYVWVRPFTRTGDDFQGRLVNDVRKMPSLNYGQMIAFDESNIVDWSYLDDRGMRGNATACALVAASPPDERAAFIAKYGLTCD